MKPKKNNRFLFAGLALLAAALVCRFLGASNLVWISVLSLGLVFKALFLLGVLRSNDFKMSVGIVLIIAGVLMILASLTFEFPAPWLRNVLFYGAILLKSTGLIMKLAESRNKSSAPSALPRFRD